jgi:hypothetical protein
MILWVYGNTDVSISSVQKPCFAVHRSTYPIITAPRNKNSPIFPILHQHFFVGIFCEKSEKTPKNPQKPHFQ